MNTYPRVDLTYHADGNVGIGTPPDASAPRVMGEPVERLRVSLTDGIGSTPGQGAEVSFANHTEWARVDKNLNVTHLDIDLCAKGPKNVYTALAMAIWNKAIAHEREACAKVLFDYAERGDLSDSDESLLKHLFELIRARGKQ